MYRNVKIASMLGLVALAAACTPRQEEVVFVEPETVVAEPVFTGKYK